MADEKSDKKSAMIDRTDKSPSPLGTAIFVGLRAADPLLQWGILARGYGSHMIYQLGGHTIPHGTHVEAIELSPYRMALFGMAVGSSLKHIFWATTIKEVAMPPAASLGAGLYNTALNSINNLLFTYAVTSAATGEDPHEPGFPSVPFVVGIIAYTVGIATEAVAEIQRKSSKKESQNKDKVFTGGLFSLSRHINYFGYTLWRFGMATASAGFIWGGFTAAFHLLNFSKMAVPELDEHCQNKVWY